jgi:uroporphyrinogen-III decarboxylase
MALQDFICKTRDFYTMKKNAPILQQEFGFYSLDRWIKEGHITCEADIGKICGFDGRGIFYFWDLGWCEAAMVPAFEEKILEDRGEYEVVQDYAGRHVLYFKGRRNGFMPEYIDHPVKDRESWEREIKWRLSPDTPERFNLTRQTGENMKNLAAQGAMIGQCVIGGYMYLRSLVGPTEILYMVYDEPDLVHDMMKAWFELADTVIAKHQQYVTLDELFLAEDICYNMGPLMSPNMMREFLFPYYRQLITNVKARQIDKTRHLYLQIDSDGDCRPVIPVYRELGADYFSPVEVASGCDVVEIAKQYPNLLLRGGFDKRIIAAGKNAIDREIDRIMPYMTERGGYIPMCDHGVPEEVSFENYLHYRKRLKEF